MAIGTRLGQLAPIWIRALLAPVIVFIATSVDRNYQSDFWHHLARGEAMAERGALVNEDLFTYTVEGQPFQDNNWLTQLLYHAVYQLGGLPLVQTVNSLTLAVTFGLLVWLCRVKCGSLSIASAVGVFVFFGVWQLLIIRPQTFSLLLFVLLYAVLEFSDRRPRLLIVAPFLIALWANLHGGFPIGLVLIGAFLLTAGIETMWDRGWGVFRDGRVWLLASCLLVCVLATCVNPYGWRIWLYVRQTSALATSRGIAEWLPPSWDLFLGKVFLASVLGMLALFILPGRRPTVREVVLAGCFLLPACGSVRMVVWWMFVTAPIAATLLAVKLPRAWVTTEDEPPSPIAAVALVVLLFVAVFCSPMLERYNPVLPLLRSTHRIEYDLARAAEHLEQSPTPPRIYSRFEWGEYLGWALAGRGKVFMDGRIEIIPDVVWRQYSVVTQGRDDWQTVLDGYQVNTLVLDSRYHTQLILRVREQPHVWQQTLEVGPVLLFERIPSGY